jgi:hypothetical protein
MVEYLAPREGLTGVLTFGSAFDPDPGSLVQLEARLPIFPAFI